MSNLISFQELPNRCPRLALRAEGRIDPYWTHLWAGGAQASWTSRSHLERLAEAGVVRLQRRDTAYDRTEARSILLDQSRQHRTLRTEGLAALGVLFQHRTLTSEQIESMTGVVHRRTSRHTAGRGGLGLGFATGLLERGCFTVGRGQVARALPDIWRPGLASKAGWLVRELSYGEWIDVTAGRHLSFGSQHDRHNLTNAELLLRAAEYCPHVAGVAGEALAQVSTIANVDQPGRGGAFADGVLVRHDGLRIAVESQNSTAVQVLGPKVERWVRHLAETTSLDEGGLVALFVDVADVRVGRGTVNALAKTIEKALEDYPWSVGRKVHQRIGLARWPEFFPAPGMVDADAFPGLKVLRPTGTGADRWQPAALLDPSDIPFNPERREDWTGTITNLAGLWGTPFWLRDDADQIDWERFLFRRETQGHPALASQLDAYGGYGHSTGRPLKTPVGSR